MKCHLLIKIFLRFGTDGLYQERVLLTVLSDKRQYVFPHSLSFLEIEFSLCEFDFREYLSTRSFWYPRSRNSDLKLFMFSSKSVLEEF